MEASEVEIEVEVESQAGFPVPNPSESYWLREPSSTLLGHRTTPDLPREADVVVVGGGITGAFACWFLLDHGGDGGGGQRKGKNVVMLEAREVGFGATGRVRIISLSLSPPLFSLCSFFY